MEVLWLHLSPTGVPVTGVYSYVETRLAAGLLELKGVVVEGAKVKPIGVEPEGVVLDGAMLQASDLTACLGSSYSRVAVAVISIFGPPRVHARQELAIQRD